MSLESELSWLRDTAPPSPVQWLDAPHTVLLHNGTRVARSEWIRQLTEALRELKAAHELDTATRDAEARKMSVRLLGRPIPPELDMDPVVLRFMLRVPMPRGGLEAIEELAPGLVERVVPHGLTPPTRLLADGSTGWYNRDGRLDDCWSAALASCLQVPLCELPDPRIDERLDAGETADEINRSAWRETKRWLSARGLRMVVHRKLPVAKRRWVGIVPQPGDFQDHALVMTRGDVLFDPSNPMSYSRPVRRFRRRDIKWGLSFQAVSASREVTHNPTEALASGIATKLPTKEKRTPKCHHQ